MKPLKLYCIGLLLCPLVCFLLETATPASALLTFEVKEKGLKSDAMDVFAIRKNVSDFERQETQVSGLRRPQMTKFKNYLSDFFKSSMPPAAIFALFVTMALMEAAIVNKRLEEPHRQWAIDQRSSPEM
ncbi:small integral membrane protein 9 [Apodemus sylvaticus]|uniref:small integral membrane protein 9 n=1 Tax=Apodemus sylvaticus TaxID=10129 RepID=UPI002243ED14|nr:small integral membrane protein 9 [Apodemus sylvaticus]